SLMSSSRSTLFPYTTLFRSCSSSVQGTIFWQVGQLTCLLLLTGKFLEALKQFRDLCLQGLQVAIIVDDQIRRGQALRAWHLCCKDRKSTRLNSSHVKISYAV